MANNTLLKRINIALYSTNEEHIEAYEYIKEHNVNVTRLFLSAVHQMIESDDDTFCRSGRKRRIRTKEQYVPRMREEDVCETERVPESKEPSCQVWEPKLTVAPAREPERTDKAAKPVHPISEDDTSGVMRALSMFD